MVKIEQDPKIINSIIIPHLLYEGLEQCLRTLWKYTPHNFKVILVDQSRNDYSHLQKEGLIDVIIKVNRNLGFAKSVNTALRLVDTEYVTILNDDVEFIDSTWWERGIKMIENDPKTAGWNPHSPVNPNGIGEPTQQYKYKNPMVDPFTEEELQEMRNVFSPGAKPGAEQNYLAGCTYCTILKMPVLREIGQKIGSPCGIVLFDESFGTGGGEDYHFVRTLGLHGYKILGTQKVFVWHWWLSTRKLLAKYGYGEAAGSTTAKGYTKFMSLWGPMHGSGPNDTPDGADVYGRSGPKEPLNGQPWFTIMPL